MSNSYSISGINGPVYVTENNAGNSYTLPVIYFTEPTSGGVASTISPVQGVYTLTGETQTLGVGLPAVQGSYTLTGEPQTLNRGITISAVKGTYTLTGKPQGLLRGINVSAVQGSYTLTGQAQGLNKGKGLSAVSGTYTVTGEPISFVKSLSIAIVQGVYSVLGKTQNLNYTPANTAVTSGKWRWLDGVKDLKPVVQDDVKAAAAVLSKMGGHARAKSLTSNQRSNIASTAAKARWK